MLFDPFEKQFDLPAALVELCDNQSIESKVVCQEDKSLVRIDVVINDPPEWFGIAFRGFRTC
ncbi:unnamed protein product, partial [marine sediment metagenome]